MNALSLAHGALRFIPDQPRPTPSTHEALIRVLRAGICNTDLELLQGYQNFAGIPGHEFVGRVEACASQPRLIGQRVVGEINVVCGACQYCQANMRNHCLQRRVLGIHDKHGAFAEYLTLPIENLHLVPESISDVEAVFVEPLAACFEIGEQVAIGPDTKVLVLGDGKLGLLAAQVLVVAGAQVTVQGKHAAKLTLAQRLGLRTSLAVSEGSQTLERIYDLVVECTGSPSGLETARHLIKPRGTIVLKSTVASPSTLNMSPFVVDEITIVGSRCGPFAPALAALQQKQVTVTPLLSATYPLQAGAEAFRHASQKGCLKIHFAITE